MRSKAAPAEDGAPTDAIEAMQSNLITTALPAINAIPAVCRAPAGIRTYADLPLIAGAGVCGVMVGRRKSDV